MSNNRLFVVMLDHEKSEMFIYETTTDHEKRFYKNHNVIGVCFASISFLSFEKARKHIYKECFESGWSYNPDRNDVNTVEEET